MRIKIIGCSVLQPELEHCRPKESVCIYNEFALHLSPEGLRSKLQTMIDETRDADILLLGYGRCGNGTVGLEARTIPLILPRVDDCLALLLGSREAYIKEYLERPGTYYFTQGWIENGNDPYKDFKKWLEKSGQTKSPAVIARAEAMTKETMKNYNRVAIIDTGVYPVEDCWKYSKEFADYFGLECTKLKGSLAMVEKLCRGDCTGEFLLIEPGHRVTVEMFNTTEAAVEAS